MTSAQPTPLTPAAPPGPTAGLRTPKRAKRDKRAERREQILEGLFEAMSKRGTQGTSITEIAQAAGIARGALHYYFESKEEIRLRLMERLGERYLGGLEAYLDRLGVERAHLGPAGVSEARVRGLVRYHLGADDETLEQMLGVWIDFWGHAPSDRTLQRVVLDVQERARLLCRRVLVEARPEFGQLHEAQLRPFTAALLSVVEGSILQWRIAAGTDRELDRRQLADASAQAAWALVCGLPAPTASDADPSFASSPTGDA